MLLASSLRSSSSIHAKNIGFLCSTGILAIALLTLLVVPDLAFAQTSTKPYSGGDEAAGATGCAACGGCGLFFIFAIVAAVALNIALLVWVARDAKARGMDGSAMWMILVMFTGLIGFVIYIFSRPQGNMIRCAHCGNSRLQASRICPHCSNA
ncbi:MAG: PLDc N-terminal domain-containing protein [Gemmataceae bacterium]|nr:PLDc N-terminal domain-containing protein [Gemmataceae bacterium]